MSDFSITVDSKSLAKLTAKLQAIERKLDTKKGTPLFDVMKITSLDIAREAKKVCPVQFGRLRASIHPKFSTSDTFIYSDSKGRTYNGGLREPIKEGVEIAVGTNVTYALNASEHAKDESRRRYMQQGYDIARPAMDRRLKQLAKQTIQGK